MTGGVLGAGQQQAIAVVGLRVEIGQRLDEGGAIEAGVQIGGGEIHGLVGAQREQRAVEPLEKLPRGERGDSGWRRDRAAAVVGRVGLVLGAAIDERGGDPRFPAR